jgi:hypothetical protein
MGIGAMCVAMLRLPFTSVLLATLLFFSDGLAVTPVVIVAVVVSHVVTARLAPPPEPAAPAQADAAPAPTAAGRHGQVTSPESPQTTSPPPGGPAS